MSGAKFLVGDVRARMTQLDDATFDLILCSPPFLALRSYLPDGHPDKALEIGSEATPAEYLDVMLELTAEWGRLLTPHGSIAIELGDTYAGSGGGGGDYLPGGLREGEPGFGGSAAQARQGNAAHRRQKNAWKKTAKELDDWVNRANLVHPLDKSLMCVPQLYQVALAYGINPLTGQPSPAGRWRVRNLKPWIRSNPPVGALGDKERPATSYVIVATRAVDRYFDLDAVRTTPTFDPRQAGYEDNGARGAFHDHGNDGIGRQQGPKPASGGVSNPGGAPPRDWWHHTDNVLQAELDRRAGKYNGGEVAPGSDVTTPGRIGHAGGDPDNNNGRGRYHQGERTVGAQGHHLRRALERAGILASPDVHDISPKGYSGSHYAVWPMELVRQLVNEMCPPYACLQCGRALGSGDVSSTTVPGVRCSDSEQASPAQRATEDSVLFGGVRQPEHLTEPRVDQGMDQGREGLHPGSGPGASDGEPRGLRDGTPAGHGEAHRPGPSTRRDRPSPQRGQGRQQDPELGAAVEVEARPAAQATTEAGALPALRGDALANKKCAHCGGAVRRGRILDPFVGSGTTLAVTTGMARDAVGIDLDPRNALLATERVGMFLDVDDGTTPPPATIDVIETL